MTGVLTIRFGDLVTVPGIIFMDSTRTSVPSIVSQSNGPGQGLAQGCTAPSKSKLNLTDHFGSNNFEFLMPAKISAISDRSLLATTSNILEPLHFELVYEIHDARQYGRKRVPRNARRRAPNKLRRQPEAVARARSQFQLHRDVEVVLSGDYTHPSPHATTPTPQQEYEEDDADAGLDGGTYVRFAPRDAACAGHCSKLKPIRSGTLAPLPPSVASFALPHAGNMQLFEEEFDRGVGRDAKVLAFLVGGISRERFIRAWTDPIQVHPTDLLRTAMVLWIHLY
ncbi:hypothetical protein C8R43DRAFT_963222 [Mycena crocata]|nr:hypothetical protein C8R43DRAFT_963222 [Mycena crocata]